MPDIKPKPIFVCVPGSNVVMRAAEFICSACSRTMAKRIANALNKHIPNARGE